MCGCGCVWVILNKVKNLVISVIASALTLSDPSTALRYAQDDKHSLRSWVGFYLPASWGERVMSGGGVGEIATGKALAMTLRVYFYIPASWWGVGEIATSRADSRNDVAGILLPTRIVGERFFWGAWCVRVR